jgi:hypothetical protein
LAVVAVENKRGPCGWLCIPVRFLRIFEHVNNVVAEGCPVGLPFLYIFGALRLARRRFYDRMPLLAVICADPERWWARMELPLICLSEDIKMRNMMRWSD